ncbi:hypothetical protein CD110_12670 [Staphylococcus casei]|nr:hypothetical protein CD110_12670 [Staphylococcus casei]
MDFFDIEELKNINFKAHIYVLRRIYKYTVIKIYKYRVRSKYPLNFKIRVFKFLISPAIKFAKKECFIYEY